jgi:hypothetical protein
MGFVPGPDVALALDHWLGADPYSPAERRGTTEAEAARLFGLHDLFDRRRKTNSSSCSSSLYSSTSCITIIVNMTTDGKSSERETLEAFYPELLDEEGVQLADALEDERVAGGTDQKKKDNRWHSFTTT